MRAVLLAGTLAIGAALALTGCHSGAGQSTAAARGVAGVAAGSVKGPAGRLAASFARASGTARPAYDPGSAVHFHMIAYYPIITNAGTPYGYAVFVQYTRDVRVLPSSAATLEITGDGPARLTTPAERARWRAAGRPSLPHLPTKPLPWRIPAGGYSFVPQGKPLTYHAAASLPASAAAVSREIRARLADSAHPHPRPAEMLTQLGYLLAAAPLTTAGRSAVWMSVATLPGLRLCPGATDLAGRHGKTLCASAGGHETELIVDPAAGSVLAVEDRLLKRSADYPGMSPGTLLQSTTFTDRS